MKKSLIAAALILPAAAPSSNADGWIDTFPLEDYTLLSTGENRPSYYEIALEVKEHFYQALVPINSTVLLAAEPIVETESISVDRY